jgi:hypothetical protein
MKYVEAINQYQLCGCKNIVVRTRSGKEYELNRDVVENAHEENGDLYVYGGYWKKVRTALRPKYHHKWFWLSNVEFVRQGGLTQ